MTLDINGLMIAKIRLKQLHLAETHQTSKMKLFGKTVNGLNTVNYFRKKIPS